MVKIGLALGSGGARGLAHIILLEAFEELGIKPCMISGCSIGAIIGAAYASGMSPSDMKNLLIELITSKNGKFWEFYKRNDFIKMLEFIDPQLRSGGFIKGEKFIKFFKEKTDVKYFKDLKIPLKVIATEYWEEREIILESGNLLNSIRASYSLPGLFTPIRIGDKLLMDGGLVNPLPYDALLNECDITIAIDVSAKKIKKDIEVPPAYEALFSAFQIMQNSIIKEKLNFNKPDILIKTDIQDVRVLEFNKAESIFEQALPYKQGAEKRT